MARRGYWLTPPPSSRSAASRKRARLEADVHCLRGSGDPGLAGSTMPTSQSLSSWAASPICNRDASCDRGIFSARASTCSASGTKPTLRNPFAALPVAPPVSSPSSHPCSIPLRSARQPLTPETPMECVFRAHPALNNSCLYPRGRPATPTPLHAISELFQIRHELGFPDKPAWIGQAHRERYCGGALACRRYCERLQKSRARQTLPGAIFPLLFPRGSLPDTHPSPRGLAGRSWPTSWRPFRLMPQRKRRSPTRASMLLSRMQSGIHHRRSEPVGRQNFVPLVT